MRSIKGKQIFLIIAIVGLTLIASIFAVVSISRYYKQIHAGLQLPPGSGTTEDNKDDTGGGGTTGGGSSSGGSSSSGGVQPLILLLAVLQVVMAR